MKEIPPAFAAMANYRQWMLFRLVPSRRQPGKMDKLPCHPVTGIVTTAHNPNNWADAQTCIAAAQAFGSSYGVAFVFTADDPFWFLDLDDVAMPDGTWHPEALEILGYFSGCAVEVSSSGTGLHIIGAGAGHVPPHGKKNKRAQREGRSTIDMEFYTEGRFVALTGTQASGDSGFEPPVQNLQWLALHHFPYNAQDADGELSDAPDPEWRGPEDDDELIRRAMRSASSGAAFSNRASFADLWTANVDVLAKAYPADPSSDTPYDASSADSALAWHLAFWTGRHGERIRRLMDQSALKRDKWDRDDYMVATISAACGRNRDVLQDKLPGDAPIAADVPLVHADSNAVSEVVEMPEAYVRPASESSFIYPEDQREFFKGCVYVRSVHRVWVPSGELLKPEAFAVAYGGYSFPMDRENARPTTSAWEAFTQSRVLRHSQVAATCFRPKLPPGAIVDDGGRRAVNTYLPPNVIMREGDPSIFLEHLEKLFPDERDRRIFLSYLAAIVQYRGTKFAWCVVIQGVEGNGKTFFSTAVEYAIGKMYTHWPLAREINKNFNAWLFGNLLYCVEDIKIPRHNQDLLEDIKPMITGTRIQIEAKGVDQIAKDVCGNFIFNTNHKNGIRKTRNDRRLCFFFNPQQDFEDLARDGMGSEYMSRLYDWAKGEGEYASLGKDYGYSVIAHFLSNYEIDPEFNPAGMCQRAPKTSSTDEALNAGLSAAEQYIVDAIEEGKRGFRGGWVSSNFLQQLLEEVKMPYSPSGRHGLMRSLGFMPHPTLHRGRVNNVVMPDGTKPVLYIHVDNVRLREIDTPAKVAAAYSQDQG